MPETCKCGWLLPLMVVPVQVEDARVGRVTEDSIVGGAAVALKCPVCGEGHATLVPNRPADELQCRCALDKRCPIHGDEA